jgi:hypothetical protein
MGQNQILKIIMKTTNQELRQDLHRAGLLFDETKIYTASYSPPFANDNRLVPPFFPALRTITKEY